MQYYHEYQASDPLHRGQIRPDLSEDLRSPTFARLESRAVQMLLQAVPESISNQAMATRTLSSVGILYQVLKQYQPGFVFPAVSAAQDAVLYLQGWFRHVARARAMSVQLPDGSLLLSALDGLARPLLSQNAQVAFRLSLTRHTLRLDYQSDLSSVEEYARTLLAEFEVLALSGSEVEGPQKRQRVRRIADPNSPNTSGLRPDPKPPSSAKACNNWLSAHGCKYGARCNFHHDMESETLQGRCFYCSSPEHWANSCPIKNAHKSEDRTQALQTGAETPKDPKDPKANPKTRPGGRSWQTKTT